MHAAKRKKCEVPAIGIDLGTSFSCVAVYFKDKLEIIPNKEGHRLTPSFVFYNKQNSGISVGTTADQQGISCPDNFFFDVKRIIGRKYDDAYVQLLRESDSHRFTIVDGPDGNAIFQFEHDGSVITKSPEEVSSEILKYLKDSASEYLGMNIDEAVISIPAYFNNAQRKATIRAAELAGLKVLRLISEPVAGALYYSRENSISKGKILVYDLGGGTLDISVIQIKGKHFEVLNVEGDTFLGGRDMDEELLKYFKEKLKEAYGEKVLKPRLLRRLKGNCITLKEKLSLHDDFSVQLECVGGDDDEFTLTMTREIYESLIKELIERSMYTLKKCLNGHNVTRADINTVVLIGGVTRTPLVRETLKEYFGAEKLRTDINPDEAVALGVACQAALLKRTGVKLKDTIITEVTPLSLGVETNKGYMLKIIQRCSKLPALASKIISTSRNNQDTVPFKIYEGERKQTKFNNFLGVLVCKNVPKGRAGAISIEARFHLNRDGILEVEACVLSTQQKTKLNITLQEHRMCQNEISSNIQDARDNILDDNKFECFINVYRNVLKVTNNLLYDLSKIPLITDREHVEEKCSKLLKYMDSIDHKTSIIEILKEYINFHDSVTHVTDIFNVDLRKCLTFLTDNLNKANI
ncbi:chaperone protein DnaK-like [Rhynchophorus ferrugineus]|uniref:chaperone protein DnaK-like n=1 Tax=Rhynchophorus ferrugineus TaxID=354439 RepID=UPI003FCEA91D